MAIPAIARSASSEMHKFWGHRHKNDMRLSGSTFERVAGAKQARIGRQFCSANAVCVKALKTQRVVQWLSLRSANSGPDFGRQSHQIQVTAGSLDRQVEPKSAQP